MRPGGPRSSVLPDKEANESADGRLGTWHGFIYDRFFVPLASPKNASLLFALAYLLLWLGLMWILYRRRIFVKI